MTGSTHPAHQQAAARLLAALGRRGETVATAESLTAGLVCARLTEVPGASEVVRGGVIVYATDLKERLAGVDSGLLAEYGAVHPETARALADGACARCGAVWGLGLTGVAGPEPQDGVDVGTVHLGLAGPATRTSTTVRLPGGRDAVREGSVDAAVELLLEHVDR